MKLPLSVACAYLATTHAFAPSLTAQHHRETVALNLFGNRKEGEAKGPAGGMMDQLAMFKKAQEMASKKKEIDAELAKLEFQGESEDGNVKISFKYVPGTNPMDPNPEYDPVDVSFDEAFFESASPEDLSEATRAAILNGVEVTNKAVAEKYQTLQSALMEAFSDGKQE